MSSKSTRMKKVIDGKVVSLKWIARNHYTKRKAKRKMEKVCRRKNRAKK